MRENPSHAFTFTPKYRKAVFLSESLRVMVDAIFRKICESNKWEIGALTIMPDHVHLVVALPRTIAVSVAVQKLKGFSSYEIRHMQAFKYLKAQMKDAFWGRRYWHENVGPMDKEAAERYAKNQEIAWQRKYGRKPFEHIKIAAKPVPQRRLP